MIEMRNMNSEFDGRLERNAKGMFYCGNLVYSVFVVIVDYVNIRYKGRKFT